MEKLIPILSLLLLAAIVWMWLNPTEAMRQRRTERQKQISRKKAHKAKQDAGEIAPIIGINSVTAMRGDSTHHLTRIMNHVINFPGIEKGYFSETVYVVVNGHGVLTQFTTEVAAQNAYQKGDYGISAITMSKGVLQTRDIKPDIIHEDNVFKLIFGMVLSSK